MVPREAYFARTEQVKPKDAVGRISAELRRGWPSADGVRMIAEHGQS